MRIQSVLMIWLTMLLVAPMPSVAGEITPEDIEALLAETGFQVTKCPPLQVDVSVESTCVSFDGTMPEFMDEWNRILRRTKLTLRAKRPWSLPGCEFYAYRENRFQGAQFRVTYMNTKPQAVIVFQYNRKKLERVPSVEELREGIVEPKAVVRPKATYPELARQARVEGVAIVETIIGKDGNVRDPMVMDVIPMGLGFEKAALDAVKVAKYEPATHMGEPVEVYLTIRIDFSLH